MRGGGAGSWGVIVSATFQTFPTFDAAVSYITITTNTTDQMAEVAEVHAQHIFDLDALRAGQYFYVSLTGFYPPSLLSPLLELGHPAMIVVSYFPSSIAQAQAALKPFIDDVQKVPGVTLTQRHILQNINSALTSPGDAAGTNSALGSRLIPAMAYENPSVVRKVYSELLNEGTSL